jgi:hypothetical protein
MGVSVTPSAAQQIEWQVHPTVVSQAGSGAGVIGQTVVDFHMKDAVFQSLISGGAGLQPTICIDCENAGRPGRLRSSFRYLDGPLAGPPIHGSVKR